VNKRSMEAGNSTTGPGMRSGAAILLAASLSGCAGSSKPAMLLPDTLVCAPAITIAQILQNTRAATGLPASKVIRSTEATAVAIVRNEIAPFTMIPPPTIDANVQRYVDRNDMKGAVFMASVLLNNCESSGDVGLPVVVLERLPMFGLVKVSMTFRGATETIYVERGQVTE
jgi:hypothetical protein